MIEIRQEKRTDVPAREAMLDAAFGANRHNRTCHRLREGRVPADGLALSATHEDRLVGTLRLWPARADGVDMLVLGPLAVVAGSRSLGVGAALMQQAIAEAARRGHGGIVLLGDAPYYERFGFSAALAEKLALPGPFERERLLGLELREGALAEARGIVRPTGKRAVQGAPARVRRPQRRAA